MEKNCLSEQFHAIREKLPEGDIVMVVDDLNAKVDSENTLIGHVRNKRGFNVDLERD